MSAEEAHWLWQHGRLGVHSNINKGREEGRKREGEVTMKWGSQIALSW